MKRGFKFSALFFSAMLLTSAVAWAEGLWILRQLGSNSNIANSANSSSYLLGNASVQEVWGWDASVSNWVAVFRNPPAQNPISPMVATTAGYGYWLKVSGATTIPATSGNSSVMSNLTANSGWQLVGADTALPFATLKQTYIPNLPNYTGVDSSGKASSGGSAWLWDETTGTWLMFAQTNATVTILDNITLANVGIATTNTTSGGSIAAGRGFWVNMGGAASLTPPMVGKVTTYPNTLASSTNTSDSATTISQDDLQGEDSLVSLYLLSDTEFANPVATVKSDAQGNYTVTAEDLMQSGMYLATSNRMAGTATAQDYSDAFKKLGNLQVRALVFTDADGDGQSESDEVEAVTAVADPTSTEAVKVNPIVSSLIKSVLDAVKTALQPLKALFSGSTLDTLINSVLKTVETTITSALSQAETKTLEIPKGQDPKSVIASQRQDTKVNFASSTEFQALKTKVENKGSRTDVANTATVSSFAMAASSTAANTANTASATLKSSESGLVASLSANLNKGFETVTAARTDLVGSKTEELKANQLKLKKETLQRFFLAMGFTVILGKDDTNNGAIAAIAVQVPPQIADNQLPGSSAFGDRFFRCFSIGTASGVSALNSNDQPICSTAPTVQSQLASFAQTLAGTGTVQERVNALQQKTNRTVAENNALDRVRVFHAFLDELKESLVVSDELIQKLVENDKNIALKTIAAVVATNFQWVSEQVNVTPEGLPISTGRKVAPADGSTVGSSDLVRKLTITLGTDPAKTADNLTTDVAFLAQFTPDAVDEYIRREKNVRGANFNLKTALKTVYDTLALLEKESLTQAQKNTLLKLFNETQAYLRARDAVARGLTAAISPSLYGKTLTSEDTVSVTEAFFLMNYMLEAKYLIDTSAGLFVDVCLENTTPCPDASKTRRPNYANVKELEVSSNEVSLAGLVSSLLSIDTVTEGTAFSTVNTSLHDGSLATNCSDNVTSNCLPTLPEFQELSAEQVAQQFIGNNATISSVNVSCTVERFDNQDPQNVTDSLNDLSVKVFSETFDAKTKTRARGDEVSGVTVTSALVAQGSPSYDAKRVRRTYSFTLPSTALQVTKDYVIRFGIESYQNALPEIPFFADGFVQNINVCPQPAFAIPADFKRVPVPGMSLTSDQIRPDNKLPEWISLANFTKSGAPVILTAQDESKGAKVSFKLNSLTLSATQISFVISTTRHVTGARNPGFGTICSYLQNGIPQYDLAIDGNCASVASSALPQIGLEPLLGANLGNVLAKAHSSNSLAVAPGTSVSSFTINTSDSARDQVILFRDSEQQIWLLELRGVNRFTEPNGRVRGTLDFGFVKVLTNGSIEIPTPGFNAGPINETAQQLGANLLHYDLNFGDGLVLRRGNYQGPDVLPPAPPQGSDFFATERANAPVALSYAGAFYQEVAVNADNLTAIIGNNDSDPSKRKPANYRSVPARLDAQGTVKLARLTFKAQTRTYLLSTNLATFVADLKNGEVIALWLNTTATLTKDAGSPDFLLSVQRGQESDPNANARIGLDIVRLTNEQGPIAGLPPILHFTSSPETQSPVLYFDNDLATAVGNVEDRDFDGVLKIFDPNDANPNIGAAGQQAQGSNQAQNNTGAVSGNADVRISLLVEPILGSDGRPRTGVNKRSLLIEFANTYPGDIDRFSIANSMLFGTTGNQLIFSCTPPSKTGESFTSLACDAATNEVVTISQDTLRDDYVAFKASPPTALFTSALKPGERPEFNVEVKFRAPKDVSGNVLKCGSSDCPSRPDIKTKVKLYMPKSTPVDENLGLFDNIKIAVGTETAKTFDTSVTELDAGRQWVITADAVRNATDYALEIFCAGEQTLTSFKAPVAFTQAIAARDQQGNPAAFRAQIQSGQIPGGYSCNIALVASGKTKAGDFLGYSEREFTNLLIKGGNQSGINNELKLTQNQAVCFAPETQPSGNTPGQPAQVKVPVSVCDTSKETTLFTVQSIANQSATLNLASTTLLQQGSLQEPPKTIATGAIQEGGFLKVDSLSAPNCGAIASASQSGPQDFRDAFECPATTQTVNLLGRGTGNQNGSTLTLAQGANFTIKQQPSTTVTSISATQGAFYSLNDNTGKTIFELEVRPAPVVGSTSGAMVVQVELRKPATTSTQQQNSTSLVVQGGRFFQLLSPVVGDANRKQPVDIEVRFVSNTEARIAWFLPAPQKPMASTGQGMAHNLDGAAPNTDVSVADSGTNYVFTFATHTEVQVENPPGIFKSAREAGATADNSGNLVYTTPKQANGEYRFDIRVKDTTNKTKSFKFVGRCNNNNCNAEWFEFVGGAASGTGNTGGNQGPLLESPLIGNDAVVYDNGRFFIEGAGNLTGKDAVFKLSDTATGTLTVGDGTQNSPWFLKLTDNDTTKTVLFTKSQLQTMTQPKKYILTGQGKPQFSVELAARFAGSSNSLLEVAVRINQSSASGGTSGGTAEIPRFDGVYFSPGDVYFITTQGSQQFTRDSANDGRLHVLSVRMSSTSTSYEITIGNTTKFSLNGAGVINNRYVGNRDGKEQVLQFLSNDPNVPKRELKVRGDQSGVYVTLQPVPTIFKDNLFNNEAILFDVDTTTSSVKSARKEFDGQNNKVGAVLRLTTTMAGTVNNFSISTSSGWTLKRPASGGPVAVTINSVNAGNQNIQVGGQPQNVNGPYVLTKTGFPDVSLNLGINFQQGQAFVEIQQPGFGQTGGNSGSTQNQVLQFNLAPTQGFSGSGQIKLALTTNNTVVQYQVELNDVPTTSPLLGRLLLIGRGTTQNTVVARMIGSEALTGTGVSDNSRFVRTGTKVTVSGSYVLGTSGNASLSTLQSFSQPNGLGLFAVVRTVAGGEAYLGEVNIPSGGGNNNNNNVDPLIEQGRTLFNQVPQTGLSCANSACHGTDGNNPNIPSTPSNKNLRASTLGTTSNATALDTKIQTMWGTGQAGRPGTPSQGDLDQLKAFLFSIRQ